MGSNFVQNVPRYFEAYVNDCFSNVWASLIQYLGQNPAIALADYLSFMYDETTDYVGVNFFFKYTTTVEYGEEEMNTSFEFIYNYPTTQYDKSTETNRRMDKDKINLYMYISDDANVAYERVKELIDSNLPALVGVDIYDMSYHKMHKNIHVLHAVVITGYDEENGYFELFDKHLLSESNFDGKLPIEEINKARISDNLMKNPMIGDYNRPIRHFWMEIDVGETFKVTKERIYDILEESCQRMLGQKEILGQRCGLQRIDDFRKDLLLKKEIVMDERGIFLFRTYYFNAFKSIVRNRNRFKVFIEAAGHVLSDGSKIEILCILEESSKKWEICASLFLKIGISKQMKSMDNLDKQLTSIIEIESRLIEKLSASIKAGIKQERKK
jgi:hypothetical protein